MAARIATGGGVVYVLANVLPTAGTYALCLTLAIGSVSYLTDR